MSNSVYRVSLENQLGKLLSVFDEAGEATDDEAAFIADLWASNYRGRCTELRNGGYIEPVVVDGEVQRIRGLTYGRLRVLSRITEKGRQTLKELREQ